ncbi:DUF1016 N-terminal domain-containing protein [Paraburkholderia graminis]|uniref:Nuclease of restriction endonuclease-like (RecB) superfamily n=1 Tax=Paraburkholderia graminis TaxID=60548 RepID=A0ABD5CT22_9BURK|nr:DUF1016 N-terminal domain-containing protein [Paraburkholderia graminis]MDR6208233.1 putative nuclease of restriction endonuclease-like (RecB) superfamily [Paraburkholderia graminis]
MPYFERDHRRPPIKRISKEPDSPVWAEDYRHWFAELKQRVQRARQRAIASADRELVALYWQIGRDILDRQQKQGWGAGVVDRLARDLRVASGHARLLAAKSQGHGALAQAFPQPEFVQQPVARSAWSHVVTLLDKLDDSKQRLWYARKSLEHGWSRSVLTMQIETAATSVLARP